MYPTTDVPRGFQSEVSGESLSEYGSSLSGSGIIGTSPKSLPSRGMFVASLAGSLPFPCSFVLSLGGASAFNALDPAVVTQRYETETSESNPKSGGWVGFFRRKTAKQVDSTSLNIEGDASGGVYPLSSIGTGPLREDLVGMAMSKSIPPKLAAVSEAAEKDAEKLGMGTQSTDWADKQSSLVESIQKVSTELESQGQGNPSTPSLAVGATEAELAKYIDSKDWKGLADFSVREEVFNETELKSIQTRSKNLKSEEEKEAQKSVRSEFEGAMMTLRSIDRPTGRDEGG
jgi:hypothetical protein